MDKGLIIYLPYVHLCVCCTLGTCTTRTGPTPSGWPRATIQRACLRSWSTKPSSALNWKTFKRPKPFCSAHRDLNWLWNITRWEPNWLGEIKWKKANTEKNKNKLDPVCPLTCAFLHSSHMLLLSIFPRMQTCGATPFGSVRSICPTSCQCCRRSTRRRLPRKGFGEFLAAVVVWWIGWLKETKIRFK